MAVTRTVFLDTALSNYQSLAAQYPADTYEVVPLTASSPHADQIQNWLTSHQLNAADVNIVSASASVNGAYTPRVIFVDAGVANVEQLIAGMPANATVVVLDASRDGVQQIASYLAANAGKVGSIDIVTDLASVDVVSHGAPGEVTLGSTVLSAANLAAYSSQLAAIGSHLSTGGDILLYGCDIASGSTGQQFISALANATGADVAASTDPTGSAAAGGDWVLEASTGSIETAALNISGYGALLGNVQSVKSATLSVDSGSSSTDYLTNEASQTVKFTGSINGSGNTNVWVSTDGTGANRAYLDVSLVSGQTYSVSSVTLLGGSNRSIQFWDGNSNQKNGALLFTQPYTLDQTIATPTVSLKNDTGIADGRTTDATLLFNTPESDVTRVITVDGKGVASYDPGALSDGSHTVVVTDTDTAGNTKSATLNFTLDTRITAPTVSLVADSGTAGDNRTNDARLSFNAKDSDATRVINVDGQTVSTYDPTGLAQGSHTITVTDTDGAGNSKSASLSFVYDTQLTTPSVSLATDSGTPGDKLTNDASLVFNAKDSDATRVITVDGKGVPSYDPSALSDGSHTVVVTDTDGANSKTTTFSFVLDKTAPIPNPALVQDTGASNTDKVTSNGAVNFGALENGATRVIKVDNNVVTNYDAAGLAEGSHTIEVLDTDAAGNTGKQTLSFILDRTAPAVTASLSNDTGSSNTDGITRDATLSLTAPEKDAIRTFSIDGQAATASYDPTTLSEGQHTVQVIDTDLAGNQGKSTVSFILDKTAPIVTASLANDTGTSNSDGITRDAALKLTAVEKNAIRSFIIDGQAATGYDPASLLDGKHTVIVTDTDTAGNKTSVTTEFTLDTKLTAPTAALASDSGLQGDGLTNDATLSFNAADSDATRVFTVDGRSSAGYDPKSLADGHHTVIVTDTDAAGNTASVTTEFTLDTKLTAPTAKLALDSGTDGDGLTNKADLVFNTADSDAKRVIKVDGNEVSIYDPKSLADGHHTVIVTDTDAAGNTASVTTGFTLDTKLTAPTAKLALDSGTDGDGLTNKADLVFNAADSDAKRVIKVDNNEVSNYDPKSLADGHHTVIVTDTDAAGNTASVTTEFTLDTKLTAPTAKLVLDSGTDGDGLTNKADLVFNTADSDATRVITVDGKGVGSYDPKSLADGHHTVIVTDTDAAGNTASVTTEFTLDTKLTAPTAKLALDSGTDGDGLTNKADLVFNTADSDAKRVITVDGKSVDSYDPKSLADGKHTVVVTDTDAAGNTASVTTTFTLDTKLTAPTAKLALDSGTDGDGLTNKADLVFSTTDSDATRVIKVDGNLVGSYDPSKLVDGKHTVEVTDTDLAGNTATASTSFVRDSKGPAFSSPTIASVAENIGENQVVYKAVASDANGVSYSLTGSDAAKFTLGADGSVTLKENPNYEAVNAYAFTVVATDGAGNHTDLPVALSITNVNEAPVATSIAAWTIESAAIGVQMANYVSDPDAGDKLSVSLGSNTATLSWANTDAKISTALVNPVTHATVDLSTLSVKASIGSDGQLTLTPPAELDWLSDGQIVKASFSYTATDGGGLSSSESISLLIKGSTNAPGANLSGGNGDDVLSGNATNNAADVLMGNNGNDTLYGYGGTDALYGGNGDDKLYGGAGIDYLYGDNGNDTLDGGSEGDYLFGGKGNDILIGGTGADKFVFAPQNGNDRIMDFNAAEGDMLYFADFFSTPPTVDAFLSKYVTDTGNDLQINLTGTTIVLVGVANVSDLKGHIGFGNPV